MASFHPASRYASAVPVEGTDAYGQTVRMVPFRVAGAPAPVARYRRTAAQRLDHIAASLLGDAHGYWRICDANGAIVPDALADVATVDLPDRGS